jgi:hypothetical protein
VSCRLDYGESITKNRIVLSPRPVEEIVFIGWLEKWWRRQEIFTVNKISISLVVRLKSNRKTAFYRFSCNESNVRNCIALFQEVPEKTINMCGAQKWWMRWDNFSI